MVTQNMHFLESHLALPREPPPIMENDAAHQSRTLSRARLSPEKKVLQREDPMSHRIIEKRRRDRMNNCLADLSRLIPADYLKKGRGRIEKTEIIEMAIKHMKHLHGVLCARSPTANVSELPLDSNHLLDNYELDNKGSTAKEENCEPRSASKANEVIELDSKPEAEGAPPPINLEHFKLGYQECLSESMHYLVEMKGYYPGSSLCMQLICHLQKHCDKLLTGDRLNKPRAGDSNSTSNSPNSSSKPHGSGSSSGDSCERLQLSSTERLHPKPEPTDTAYDIYTPRESSGYDSTFHQQNQVYERGLSRYDAMSYQARDYSLSPRDNQGRDNLTLPNLSLFNIEQEHHQGTASSRHTNESYPTETSPCPSLADNPLYKFKNNIKQRFTAEHSDYQGSSSGYLSAPPAKRSKPSETHASKYDDSPSESHYESRCHDYSGEQGRHYDGAARSVAIFALHADGTFYIPLTVDYTVLIPYLGAYSLRRSSRAPPIVLHPVTLSVCFQQNGISYDRHISAASSSEFGPGSLVKKHK